ncbi:unnamed protein product [Effrenium voratum]|uniref:Uncharacterized protein n=1 Tax=Effrenium voratum TaxID=2562239 RepID=A0AA36IVP6_9DINO|nr:unnamed protein product [Effrenium voratum]CAJ1447443.1 unnamed protein product [Effrenium voratum]
MRKVFVGSLPADITQEQLRQEFEAYGHVEEIFIKEKCPPGKQWAFVTFGSVQEALNAKEACDRTLTFPGALRPCDVMLAKNQGGGPGEAPQPLAPYSTPIAQVAATAPKKIFVGSLPDGIQEEPVRSMFSRFGYIEELFIKQGCESGRQWAFVTFSSPQEAARAQEATNGNLMFEGSTRPCEVNLARNQGLFGTGGMQQQAMQAMQADTGPKKIFVGTLPEGIDENILMDEFCKYGEVVDVFLKPNCEPGRQWGFITFASSDQARDAKASCDRILMLPGAERPCEVTIAKHQGLFGQDDGAGRPAKEVAGNRMRPTQAPERSFHSVIGAGAPIGGGPARTRGAGGAGGFEAPGGACKIFVGSLPDGCSEQLLRSEFSRYGRVTDIYVKQNCDPGRQWAFVTFTSAAEALQAKEATDRALLLPGAQRACEVMLAKNQGMFGQAPLAHGGAGGALAPAMPGQPPPPKTPPPAHLTPWRTYKTQSGLPYYHNSQTGQTVWECPTEFEPPPGAVAGRGGSRYNPY